MFAQIHFTGPAQYRVRSTAEVGESAIEVSLRRMLRGPQHPGWTWFVELCTDILRTQVRNALEMRNVSEARRYLNSVVISSPALSGVWISRISENKIKGRWFSCKDADDGVTLLYFHGGGYSFYPRPYENVIAMITLAARARTFALDYSLTPERRFPAQLYEALNAYRWLLARGDPGKLVIAGDSAGANLTLALLLAIGDAKLPPPALAIALSPPTDFGAVIPETTPDWIDKKALLQWADWFCSSGERRDPLISPIRAKLRLASDLHSGWRSRGPIRQHRCV